MKKIRLQFKHSLDLVVYLSKLCNLTYNVTFFDNLIKFFISHKDLCQDDGFLFGAFSNQRTLLNIELQKINSETFKTVGHLEKRSLKKRAAKIFLPLVFLINNEYEKVYFLM